jgi:hypothetical protein
MRKLDSKLDPQREKENRIKRKIIGKFYGDISKLE